MTTDLRYIRDIVRTDIDADFTDFGMRDHLGRAIGCRWFLQHCAVVYLTDAEAAARRAQGDCLWVGDAAGADYVELNTQPTRNSQRYGPSMRRKFATEAEARAALFKHLVKAYKYNAKVNARAPVPA